MAEPTNEAGLVAAIRREIDRTYGDRVWHLKVHGGPMQRIGVPDLLVAVDGILVGIEVKFKRPGESRTHALGRVSAIQEDYLYKMRLAGITAGVALTIDEALGLITEALRKAENHG